MVRTSSSCHPVIAFLMAKGTVRVQILREYFCGQYFLNHVTFVSETDSSMGIIMNRSVMQTGWVPIFKVEVTMWAQILKKQNCFFHISWTSEPVATKHGIVMHHHEPECFASFVYCCPHGEGHSEGCNLQGLSSEPVKQQGVSCRTRQHLALKRFFVEECEFHFLNGNVCPMPNECCIYVHMFSVILAKSCRSWVKHKYDVMYTFCIIQKMYVRG